MSALLLALISIAGFLLAYFVYGRFLQDKIFRLLPDEKVPSRTRQDGIDFVPTRRGILFSHHFVSIAGLGPIMGPAIGVIWGWLPALAWVFFGTIFLGAVHDFGALIISLRHEGRSIGDLVRDLIGFRAGTLFMLVIFFLLALSMGVFVYIVAVLFTDFYPESVVPVFSLMPIAMLVGYLIYRRNISAYIATLIGIVLMFGMLAVGMHLPVPIHLRFLSGEAYSEVASLSRAGQITVVALPATLAAELEQAGRPDLAAAVQQARVRAVDMWSYVLLIYSFWASVLPVWFLLQPRDYINSYQLYLGMILMYVGLFMYRPLVVAPAFHPEAGGLPPLFPFLFITIACGAISGFHNLVSSGTTARQLSRARDARFVSYGGMLAEGMVAVVVILACVSTHPSREAWLKRYADYRAIDALAPTLNIFIAGAGALISRLGLPAAYAAGFISVVVVGFALTTLDTGTRLMRYDIEALAQTFRIQPLTNRYLSSLLGVAAIGYFALMKIGGKPAGLTLWQLFGTANQLLAALGLLAVSVYLFEQRRKTVFTLLPMGFMLAVTFSAMVLKLMEFWQKKNLPLIITAFSLLVLTVWLLVEALLLYRLYRFGRKTQEKEDKYP